MTRISWEATGQRFFETGVDRGVLYVGSNAGVPWTGLTSVAESPSGGETTAYYLDGVKYLNVASSTEFEGTLKAFMYPAEFEPCEGLVSPDSGLIINDQPRSQFGLSYRTRLGNDVAGVDYSYKIHLIYNALATPSEREHATISDGSTPTDFSWTITAVPPPIPGYKPTAHLTLDASRTDPAVLAQLENILYGSASTAPRLPLPTELVSIFAA